MYVSVTFNTSGGLFLVEDGVGTTLGFHDKHLELPVPMVKIGSQQCVLLRVVSMRVNFKIVG